MPASRLASNAAAPVAVPQKQPEEKSRTASFVQAPASGCAAATTSTLTVRPRKSNADIMAIFQTASDNDDATRHNST